MSYVCIIAISHNFITPSFLDYVHTPPGFDVVFNLFKSLMQSKDQVQDQTEIFIHPLSHETLSNHININVLPFEYGGNSGPIEAIIQFWEKKLIEYRDYFLEDVNYGTIEELRPAEYRHHHADFLQNTRNSGVDW